MFHLNENAGIFGKKYFDEIGMMNLVQTGLQSTFGIGEAHLEHGCNHSSGRNIVSRKYQPSVDKLLNGIESVFEIFRISNRGCFVADFVQCLSESRTAKTECVE